ncbi:MAG: pilus assembly protein [Gammaproteobacteria bacterium]|uniref:TadE-like domain-containing protein n=1 Tax=Marinobacter nitratireducens TaxID=1137280 RepID=A0A072MXE3_9GAMM|nr:TadE/TadG family type IV pilus assembly protein [Marinobacter nitratireducens]KEF30079.1 hypothetical protein D777_03255 [Marinobacter nitratireducens]TNE83088.1 MAG: pilus assembly protein [Gammaproteobacteria bacterium]
MTHRRSRGAVALEFLFLFPFVVGILYASASYGVLFFNKYEMQNVVEQATNAALRVDRSTLTDETAGEAIVTTATSALEELWSAMPAKLKAGVEEIGCSETTASGISMVQCSVIRNNADQPLLPQVSFGFLGDFPPMPESMSASASVAF